MYVIYTHTHSYLWTLYIYGGPLILEMVWFSIWELRFWCQADLYLNSGFAFYQVRDLGQVAQSLSEPRGPLLVDEDMSTTYACHEEWIRKGSRSWKHNGWHITNAQQKWWLLSLLFFVVSDALAMWHAAWLWSTFSCWNRSNLSFGVKINVCIFCRYPCSSFWLTAWHSTQLTIKA